METFINNWLPLILAGSAGGAANFLFCVRRGLLKNNKFVRKFFLDILGASLVAPFCAVLFSNVFRTFVAFAVGLCWAIIIQIVRKSITKKVEDYLRKLK